MAMGVMNIRAIATEIKQVGLIDKIKPLVIGITGYGNVAKGAYDIAKKAECECSFLGNYELERIEMDTLQTLLLGFIGIIIVNNLVFTDGVVSAHLLELALVLFPPLSLFLFSYQWQCSNWFSC